MNIWQQRIAYSVTTVAIVVLVYAAGYQWAMGTFEHEAVSYPQAVQVVVESITTAGFGGHAPWSSDAMNLFVLAMNLTGVLFVFLAVPIFVVPLFREALKPHPPTAVEASDHIIVCRYTPRGDAFVAELKARDRDYVIIEPDRTTAMSLQAAGYRVVVGDPESTHTLENAGIASAAAVVADAADDTNASIALSVRSVRPDVQVVTLVEDPALEAYHRLAGADVVLSPRQLLGSSLARQVPAVMDATIEDGVEIDDHIELVELPIEAESDLCGQTVRAARLRERFGVNIIGVWKQGHFASPVTADQVLEAEMRLLVAGPPDALRHLHREVASVQRFTSRTVVIAGYGRAGAAAANNLAASRAQVIVMDRAAKPPVDVVGDVRDPAVLREAGIEDAAAAIITVDEDTTAIFAVLIMRELNPALHIIVRANKQENEQKLYRAGASYVQSLATVSGRMMASTVLEDQEVLAVGMRVEIVKLSAGALAGQTLAEADVQARTGCTVLAVIRDETVYTDLAPYTFRLAAGDAVVVAGTDERIRTFEKQFLE